MNPAGTPSAAADPWTGRVIGGRWRIVSLLDDSGGMASVYLADDERLPRKAVVKIPKAAQFNAEFAERFKREAFYHAKVENLHVVHILDRGEEAGTPFLVLQYLPGGNLKAWCAKNPSILADPRLHVESWLLPVAQALDAVAAQGIVHRDVKPSNILFDAVGKGYLSDFGIVKAGGEATMTGTGMFIGTLQFMSPEQCQNERAALDGRSDQYGLAVTAYQVLTGWRYPTVDDTAVVYAAKFGHTRMTTPREHDPRVPAAVERAVMRALSPDRDARFATSVEFAKAVLAGFADAETGTAGGSPAAAAPANAPSTRRRAPDVTVPAAMPARSGRQRRPAAAWIAVAGAIAVAGTAGAVLWSGATRGPRPADPSVDPTPRVTALNVATAKPLKAGDDLELIATFSRPVTVTGTPRIGFTVGDESTRREAVFVRGRGTDRLTFLFEVPTGSMDGTGITLARPPSIDADGGTIADAATAAEADLALEPSSSLAEVMIDGVAPRVAKVTPPAGLSARTTGDRLEFRVEFDEAVKVSGKPVLSFQTGGRSRRAEFSGGDAWTLAFAATVAADDESDDGVTVTGLALAGGTIRDAAGNTADVSFSPRKSAAFAINPRPTRPTPKPEPPPTAGPRPGTVQTNSIGMKLVVIPAGRFEMGSDETKESLRAAGFTFSDYEQFDCSDEAWVHPVRITKPFLMGVHEVTLGEFLKFYHDGYKGRLDCETDGRGCLGYTGEKGKAFTERADFVPWSWGHPSQTNDHPVVNVSWNDAVAFCGWLSRKEGKTYRLPTEAEWEYACRAGTTTRFWNGDDPDGVTKAGNVADVTAREKFPWFEGAARRDGHAFTAPVGSFRANPFGLHDMHGNVAEWCGDWYDSTAYATSRAADPKGPDSAGSVRVIRGGSWSFIPVSCRSAYRLNETPTDRSVSIGFRVVCELK